MRVKGAFGCKECGKYVNFEFETRLFEFFNYEYDDDRVAEIINEICTCPKNKKRGR